MVLSSYPLTSLVLCLFLLFSLCSRVTCNLIFNFNVNILFSVLILSIVLFWHWFYIWLKLDYFCHLLLFLLEFYFYNIFLPRDPCTVGFVSRVKIRLEVRLSEILGSSYICYPYIQVLSTIGDYPKVISLYSFQKKRSKRGNRKDRRIRDGLRWWGLGRLPLTLGRITPYSDPLLVFHSSGTSTP